MDEQKQTGIETGAIAENATVPVFVSDLPEDECDPVLGGKKPQGMKRVMEKIEKAEKAKRLFVEHGETSIRKLANKFDMPYSWLLNKHYREKWREQRGTWMLERREKDKAFEAQADKLDEAGKDMVTIDNFSEKTLIIGASLLQKLKDRIDIFQPNDVKEIKGLIEGFTELIETMVELAKTRKGGGIQANRTAVQVSILAAAVDAADAEKENVVNDLPDL